MSFITAKSFVFNGVNSEDFDVIIGWIDSEPDTSTNGLNREIHKSEKNKIKVKDNIYGTNTSEPISFHFSIVRINNKEITRPESIRINQWLTSSPLPQLLKFNDCDSYMLHYYAICTQITDIVIGGKLIGKEIIFDTNSPYAFMEKITKRFDITNTQTFYINNTADTYDGSYYPTITISTTSDCIIIENVTDKKSVTLDMTNIVEDADGHKIITMNCTNMTIVDANNKLVYASDIGWNVDYQSYVSTTDSYISNLYWLRLLNGMNEIKVTGSCNFKIECEFPRKAGCL